MEAPATRSKRKYVKKTENGRKIEAKKRIVDQVNSEPVDDEVKSDDSSTTDEEMEDKNSVAVFDDEMKKAKNVRKMAKKKTKPAVKPKKADQMISKSTSIVDDIKSDGFSTSDEEVVDKNSIAVVDDAMKKAENVRKIENKKKKPAVKPKKAESGSSTTDEEMGDGNSGAVVNVSKIEKKKKPADDIHPGADTQTDKDMKRDGNSNSMIDRANSDAVVDRANSDAVVDSGSGSNNIVTILSRIEDKLAGIARDRGTDLRMFENLVRMPYNCKESITLYNTQLLDSGLFLKFATYLESVGGINDGKIVCNMLHQIATPHLLSQFEWREASPTSFQALKNIIKVIHVAAKKICSSKYDLTVCGEIIKTALRNARGGSKN